MVYSNPDSSRPYNKSNQGRGVWFEDSYKDRRAIDSGLNAMIQIGNEASLDDGRALEGSSGAGAMVGSSGTGSTSMETGV
jgi:hypothetical protein